MKIYREDRKAIKALGGMNNMTEYPVYGWRVKGSGRYKKYIPDAWDVPDGVCADLGIVGISHEQRSEIGARRSIAGLKARRKAELNAFEKTGALPGSRTNSAYLRGEIDREEAAGIAEYTRRRHEETDYDELIGRGVSKDAARIMIEDQMY